MRGKMGIVCLIWMLVFVFFTPVACTPLSATTFEATVKSVIDGDTVHITEEVLGTTKIRLLSIDAPETWYRGKNQNPWGTKAKEYLRSLLPPGTKIKIETDAEEKDGYGRLLAYIKKGRLDVNREMIRQGLVVTYFIWPNISYYDTYQDTLVQARRNGLGIWDPAQILTELPFEFRSRIDGRGPNKCVGDSSDRTYVLPDRYDEIPVEHRIFFMSESDARKAGYKLRDE